MALMNLRPNLTGGVLFFPPGIYRTGTISIKSKVTVYLSGGARLQGTNNPADYPMDTGKIETGRSEEIFTRLVLFDNVKNAKHLLEWIIIKRNGIRRIENIKVYNIRAEGNPDSILSGYDEDHGIRGIKLIDFIYNGKALTDLKADNFKINSFVRNVEGLGMELGEATTLSKDIQ